MVTRAKQLEKTQSPAPVEKATLKLGKKIVVNEKFDAVRVAEWVKQGFALKQSIKERQEELDKVQTDLAAHIEPLMGDYGTCHVFAGEVDCELKLNEKVAIVDAFALEELLGERFVDLVKVTESFAPQQLLVEMACDADNPESPAIAALLEMKKGKTAVAYKVISQKAETVPDNKAELARALSRKAA